MELLYHFNVLDLILLIICVFFVVKGAINGFFQEIGGALGFIVSNWVAYSWYTDFGRVLRDYVKSQEWAYLLSYIGIFFCSMVLFGIFIKRLSRRVEVKNNGWVDNLGGGIIGVIKGLALCIIIVFVFDYIVPNAPYVIDSEISTVILENRAMLQDMIKESVCKIPI